MSDVPAAEQKRKLLHDERASSDDLNALADALVKAGRLGEACEPLERTRDETRLKRLRELAVSRGESFILAQTERLLDDRATADEWRAAAKAAESDGRPHHARTAYEHAGDEESAARVAAEIPAPPATRPDKAAPA